MRIMEKDQILRETQSNIDFDTDTEIIYVEGWKGKDDSSIYEGTKYFKIIEHRKEKESGEILEMCHIVTREDVSLLWSIIRILEMGEKYGANYLWRKIIELRGIHLKEGISVEQMLKAFNGGSNRTDYYFPLYYYPMKVLEAKGYVQFLGRGGCVRLKDGTFQ